IFLTTYDKHWFEIAKHYLKNNWTAIEMFAGRIDGQNFEHPIIVENSDDYFIKAKKYFEAKDYPACLNYLRKEFERLIKERLPEENTRYFEGKPHGLLFLWELCLERYANVGVNINPEIREDFNTTRLTLLNPQSHDSLHFPIYEYELGKAFELIEKIKKCPIITSIVLLSKGASLKFQHPTQNYHFVFKLTTDWRLDFHNNTKTNVFPKCKVVNWSFDEQEYWDFRTSAILLEEGIIKALDRDDKLDKILSNLEKLPLNNITAQFILENTSADGTWTLKELTEKINQTDENNSIQRINLWTKIKNIFNAL
ncbi:MAG TPA: hypothetical protein VLB84_04105, partial [Bacteroidia bacterium]|nr:hypothetical protein [Bacteroidia bacterium]